MEDRLSKRELLTKPVPQFQERQEKRERTLTELSSLIDGKLITAIKSGAFDSLVKSWVSIGYSQIRDSFSQNRSLKIGLSPHIQEAMDILQSQCQDLIGSERFPGEKARQEIFLHELFRNYQSVISGRDNPILKLFHQATSIRGPVFIEVDTNQSHQNEGHHNSVSSISQVTLNNLKKKEEVVNTLLKSAGRMAIEMETKNDLSELLRSFYKKIGRYSVFSSSASHFEPWDPFFDTLTHKEPPLGLDYTERSVLQQLRICVFEEMLKKLVIDIIKNPSTIIVKKSKSRPRDSRVLVLNSLGQGVETTHFIFEPNYLTDPANNIFYGTEFIGLVDTAKFNDTRGYIQRILAHPDQNSRSLIVTVNALYRSGLLQDRTDFTNSTLLAIMSTAQGLGCSKEISHHLQSLGFRKQLTN